ncbi:MAG: beta strand repeat-containing protein [Victivallaceae bacterium]|nr:hypothetical protein [Victivallaceae bacterium]
MITISTEVTTEQAGLADDVTITSTGAIRIGTLAAPSGSYSATMQFSGNYSLTVDGVIASYLSSVNLGVMFGKISGLYSYYDGTVYLGDSASITIYAKNSTTTTTASGFWCENLVFASGIGSGNTIRVAAQSTSTNASLSSAWANATGIYAGTGVTIQNGMAGNITVSASGGYSAWGDAQSDAIYAYKSVTISGGLSGTITSTANGAGGGTAGEAIATCITAGSKSSTGVVTIDAFSGQLTANATGGNMSGALTGNANATSYAVYGSDGVSIGSFEGELLAVGQGGNISSATATAYAQGRAFGIYSDTGDVEILAGASYGRIQAYATGGVAALASSTYATTPADASAYAYGICTHSNVTARDLEIDLTVTATGGAYGSSLYSQYGRGFAEAYGIFADGTVSITGKADSFNFYAVSASAGNSSGWAYSGSLATAIDCNQLVDSEIYAAINVGSFGVLGRTDSIADAYGVIAHEGILNSHFNGAITVTASASTTSGAMSVAHGYGIYALNRTFGNGTTAASVGDITVTVTGSDGVGTNLPSTAYGIYAGYINLEVNGTITATVNGKASYSIYIDNSGGYADTLTLRRKANFGGIVELMGGANRVFLYQGASGLGKIQATGGTLSLYFSFGSDVDSDPMAAAADLTRFSSIGYYVADDAVSSVYNVVNSGYSPYVASSYNVLCGGVTYSVADSVWTQLGDTGKWINIGVVNGSLQTAIRVGNDFYGAGLYDSSQNYWDDVVASFSGDTSLAVVAGMGHVSSGTGSLFGNISLTIDSCTVQQLYGGNSNAGGGITAYSNIDLIATDSTFGVVFGGGIGVSQGLEGGITINFSGSTVTSGFYGVGGIAVGGQYSAKEVEITIEDSTLGGYFYGGSASVSAAASANNVYGNITINFTENTVTAQVYGGNRYVSSVTGDALVSGAVNLNIDGGSFSNYVFGGGMAWAFNAASGVTVTTEVQGGVKINIVAGTFSHEVYGGGYSAAASNSAADAGAVSKVSGGTAITVANAAIINVYGGGYNAGLGSIVDGGSAITVKGNVSIGTVYGGGNGTGTAEVRAESVVSGGSAIMIDGTAGGSFTIGNIYGGGNTYCTVSGGSTVTFSGDFINSASLDFTGVLSGAGRNSATVTGTRTLSFDSFYGNIDARVMNFDAISVSGITSTAFTREFNAAGIDTVNFDLTAGRDSEVIFANTVSGWSDGASFDLHLSSSQMGDSYDDLLTSLVSSIEVLSGNTYNIYIDGSEEAYYTGMIGDHGCVWQDGDVSKVILLTMNGSNALSLHVETISGSEPDWGTSGKLA